MECGAQGIPLLMNGLRMEWSIVVGFSRPPASESLVFKYPNFVQAASRARTPTKIARCGPRSLSTERIRPTTRVSTLNTVPSIVLCPNSKIKGPTLLRSRSVHTRASRRGSEAAWKEGDACAVKMNPEAENLLISVPTPNGRMGCLPWRRLKSFGLTERACSSGEEKRCGREDV